jgi:hypothetical protein
MTTRSAAARAAAVSRLLRKAGLNPLSSGTPFHREGVRVTGSDYYTRIVVDIDSAGRAGRMADAIAEALTAAGRTFDRVDDRETGTIRFKLPLREQVA